MWQPEPSLILGIGEPAEAFPLGRSLRRIPLGRHDKAIQKTGEAI